VVRKFSWLGVAGMLALAGCISRVDREALSFPAMPNMPVYRRADSRPLSADQAIDALQAAQGLCRKQISGDTASSAAVGSPAFDSCMERQGYRRVP
jgi:hypothetical protein